MPFAVNNLPCQDPDLLRQQFGSSLDLLDGCNSYSCPLGDAVGYAYVLMRKDHFDRINGTAFVTLTVRDGYGKAVVLPDLTVVGSAAAYQTDSGTRTGAIVRVTLADRRWRYKMVAVNRQYNFRDSSGGFIAASTNGGTPWTWQGVVNDVWAKLAAALGTGATGVSATAPQLPSTPSGTPEGFSFYGTDAWAALNRVAQAAGFVLRFDPTTRAVAIVDPNRSADPLPANPPRTFDDGLWTDPTEWHTTPMVPSAVRVYFPRVQRSDAHSVESATANADVPAGPVGEAWDDMPAVGDPVSNTSALTQRAAAVTKLWESDRLSRANPNRMEFRGWQDWVRSNLGYDGWTRWAVYDRGNSPDGIGGGVMTSVNNLTPLRVEYRSGAVGSGIVTGNVNGTQVSNTRRLNFDQSTYVAVMAGATDADPDVVAIDVDGLKGEMALTTGNTSDGGANDSTTTELRFDNPTGVRVTKGATDGDPDVVSLTFNKSLTFVECVSLLVTKSGANVTDVRMSVRTRELTVSDGATIGEPVCQDNPADCCPDPVTVTCCPSPVPSVLYLTVSGGNGTFTVTHNSGNWDTGEVELTGGGSINFRMYCFGPNVNGWTVNPGGGGSQPSDYAMNSITYVTRTCSPFSVVYTATLSGTGPLNGSTLTFTVTA